MRFDGTEDFFCEHFIVRDGDGGHNGVLPRIKTVNLSYGDVETLAQTVFQALDDMPLLFERMRCFHDDVEGNYSDNGHC